MRFRSLAHPILFDDALTRQLGDPEARILVEWLVERVEHLVETASSWEAEQEALRLHRRGRAIARFVALWGIPRERGAAIQLAASEQFRWPLPDPYMDPCELMYTIVTWESAQEGS